MSISTISSMERWCQTLGYSRWWEIEQAPRPKFPDFSLTLPFTNLGCFCKLSDHLYHSKNLSLSHTMAEKLFGSLNTLGGKALLNKAALLSVLSRLINQECTMITPLCQSTWIHSFLGCSYRAVALAWLVMIRSVLLFWIFSDLKLVLVMSLPW